MSTKMNCWEFKKCGRELNGKNVAQMGICPSASDFSANGLNSGKNGGRICWAVSGTFCGGKIQGTFAEKKASCMSCEFYKKVAEEEGVINLKLLKPGQSLRK